MEKDMKKDVKDIIKKVPPVAGTIILFFATIGLATVYRVLSQFEAAGIVKRHNFEEGLSVYEIAEEEHHDHMICLDTGAVNEFSDELIEERQKLIAEKYGYELVDHTMVLYVKPIPKK